MSSLGSGIASKMLWVSLGVVPEIEHQDAVAVIVQRPGCRQRVDVDLENPGEALVPAEEAVAVEGERVCHYRYFVPGLTGDEPSPDVEPIGAPERHVLVIHPVIVRGPHDRLAV